MKAKLLQAIGETREREADLVALCADAPPDPSGRWRPQDHLAHHSGVRERDAQTIEAARTDGEVAPEHQGNLSAEIYAATCDQSAATVIAGAERSWDRLESAIKACSEEDLQRPHPHRHDRTLVDGAPGDHVATHLFWVYIEAGDEKAAEAVLRWAQDLSSRTSTDPRTHAVGTYNLACFYARTGRAHEAVPLLRQSFEVAPDLKDWSLKDPDLDPIRDDAEVRALLA